MAGFVLADLTLMAQSPKRRIWDYWTADAAATVDTAGYFNAAANLLKVGDIIFATVAVGGSVKYGMFVVNANNGSAVDVADLVELAGTDTD